MSTGTASGQHGPAHSAVDDLGTPACPPPCTALSQLRSMRCSSRSIASSSRSGSGPSSGGRGTSSCSASTKATQVSSIDFVKMSTAPYFVSILYSPTALRLSRSGRAQQAMGRGDGDRRDPGHGDTDYRHVDAQHGSGAPAPGGGAAPLARGRPSQGVSQHGGAGTAVGILEEVI